MRVSMMEETQTRAMRTSKCGEEQGSRDRGSLDEALTESLRTRPALQFPPGQNSVEFPESEAFFYILFNVYFLNEEKKEQNETK